MRKAWLLGLLSVILAMFLCGCSIWRSKAEKPLPPVGDRPSPTVKMRKTLFYFPDKSRQVIIPVAFSIPWQDGIARATLNCMIDAQLPGELAQRNLSPLLPAGTEILGLSIRDGLAKVDFNRSFLNYPADGERLLLDGLVFTLTEFSTINRVEIMVEGEKLASFPGGEIASEPLDRKRGINLSVSGDISDFKNTEHVTLYFLLAGDKEPFFVPVTKVIRPAGDIVRSAVDELLKGPSYGSPLHSAIPRGVRMESLSVSGGRVTLRLSGDLVATGGGQAAADLIRDQLALTLTELSNIKEVEVLVSGKTPQFPGGVSFPAVFGRPADWNLIPAAAVPER